MSFITTTRAVTRALTAASLCAATGRAPRMPAILLGGTRVIVNEKTGKPRSR